MPVTSTFRGGDVLPGRVEAIAMHHMDEAAFWLPSHEALVFGDSVLGYETDVRPCPTSWLQAGESEDELRASILGALDAKTPKWLLLTHGRPRESATALRQALENPSAA